LISRVCDDEEKNQIWLVEDGTVRIFPGTFENYKEDLLKEIQTEVDD
jgi:ATP-binding cassette subfamily F protein 1